MFALDVMDALVVATTQSRRRLLACHRMAAAAARRAGAVRAKRAVLRVWVSRTTATGAVRGVLRTVLRGRALRYRRSAFVRWRIDTMAGREVELAVWTRVRLSGAALRVVAGIQAHRNGALLGARFARWKYLTLKDAALRVVDDTTTWAEQRLIGAGVRVAAGIQAHRTSARLKQFLSRWQRASGDVAAQVLRLERDTADRLLTELRNHTSAALAAVHVEHAASLFFSVLNAFERKNRAGAVRAAMGKLKRHRQDVSDSSAVVWRACRAVARTALRARFSMWLAASTRARRVADQLARGFARTRRMLISRDRTGKHSSFLDWKETSAAAVSPVAAAAAVPPHRHSPSTSRPAWRPRWSNASAAARPSPWRRWPASDAP